MILSSPPPYPDPISIITIPLLSHRNLILPYLIIRSAHIISFYILHYTSCFTSIDNTLDIYLISPIKLPSHILHLIIYHLISSHLVPSHFTSYLISYLTSRSLASHNDRCHLNLFSPRFTTHSFHIISY